MKIEDFKKLPKAQSRRKVDWAQVLKRILDKPVTIRDILDVAESLAEKNCTFYYSEAVRFLSSLSKEYNVDKRFSKNDKRVYYLVTKK